MSDEEEVASGRVTRSGRTTGVKPAAKSPAQRKTRKKIVMMEVEVSDNEEYEKEAEPNIDMLKSTLEEEMNKIQANLHQQQAKEEVVEDEPAVDHKQFYDIEEDGEKAEEMEEEQQEQQPEEIGEEQQIEEEEEMTVEETIEEAEEELDQEEQPAEVIEETVEESAEEIKEEPSPELPEEPKQEETIIEEQPEVEEPKEEAAEAIEENHQEEKAPSETEEEEKMDIDPKPEEESSPEGKPAEETTTKQNGGDPDAENISEDELPGVPVTKVPETEEVSDEELPGPKRAELPADTEVVSEDELPTVKKESNKRKLNDDGNDYNPDSPTSETEGTPAKKTAVEKEPVEKEKEEKPVKPKKLPELDKYWKAVNDDPTDFTGWTYLLQYVDQENDIEAAREAYDAFLSHYPYCYGYWRKYADYEKRKGNKKKCEEVFERGLKAIPLSVDLWIHYLTHVKATKPEDEEYLRSQFERALTACGLEFRSDRLWDSYIKWETEGKRLQNVTGIYDRLLGTPTQGYTTHFDNFQEHINTNSPNKVVEVDEFLALRKEVRHMFKHEKSDAEKAESDAPPGDDSSTKTISSDEETKSIRERIISIRRKTHKSTVSAVTARWNYEEGIKRPYFHVKPLERCQLKNWQDYLDYEIEQGDKLRSVVLFERCLIACALYEEFWLKFVQYLETTNEEDAETKIRDVYERACTIHHLKKPNLHLKWAMFEETAGNLNRSAEILVNLEKSVPNVLQVAYRRINLERRRGDLDKCVQLFEHYAGSSKNKLVQSNVAIKFSRFCLRVLRDAARAADVLRSAIAKDGNNARLHLQLIDLKLQQQQEAEAAAPEREEVIEIMDAYLEREGADLEQKILFAQRKAEYLEDFGDNIREVQTAHEAYQKLVKAGKEAPPSGAAKKKDQKDSGKDGGGKKEGGKKDAQASSSTSSSAQSAQYGYNYGAAGGGQYGQYGAAGQQYGYGQYGQGDQYNYQNWQYQQQQQQQQQPGGYNYNSQWGSYGGGGGGGYSY